MNKRTLGASGLQVSAIGLGCMTMTGGYSGTPDRQEMTSLLRAAVDRGVTFFDTAEIYGPYANEELVGEALRPHLDQVVIATKFGFDIDAEERKPRGRVTSHPDSIRRVVEGSLQRLGVEAIDLLQIDTEGYDGEIIRMIDFRTRKPAIIHFEHGMPNGIMTPAEFKQCASLLMDNGYLIATEYFDAVAYRPEMV